MTKGNKDNGAIWNLSQIEVERGSLHPPRPHLLYFFFIFFLAQQAQVPCEICTVD